jgi:hypothetical protein
MLSQRCFVVICAQQGDDVLGEYIRVYVFVQPEKCRGTENIIYIYCQYQNITSIVL